MSDNTQLTTKTQDLPSEQTASEIVAQGHDRAKQLMDIVNQNQWAKNIQGRNYLQVEAWQTLGRFYNYTAITRETKYIEYGGVVGFDARVEILDKEGKVIGGAEASCMADEQNWRGKPLYSLKSMAQTRATGKAYRQILSWVAVLAGFEPTPAEEMDGVIINTSAKPTIDRPETTVREKPNASVAQRGYISALLNAGETQGLLTKQGFFMEFGVVGLDDVKIDMASQMIEKLKAMGIKPASRGNNPLWQRKRQYDEPVDAQAELTNDGLAHERALWDEIHDADLESL